MPRLCFENFNGINFISVVFNDKKVDSDKQRERHYFAISDVEAKLSLDIIERIWLNTTDVKNMVQPELFAYPEVQYVFVLIDLVRYLTQTGKESSHAEQLYSKFLHMKQKNFQLPIASHS